MPLFHWQWQCISWRERFTGYTWRSRTWSGIDLTGLTALGVVVILVYHYRRKRELDRQQYDDSVSFNYLSTNLKLFAAMFLTLWFFANWFEELTMSDETASAVVGFVWIAFNASFVVLGSVTAWQIWRDEPGERLETAAQVTQPGSL